MCITDIRCVPIYVRYHFGDLLHNMHSRSKEESSVNRRHFRRSKREDLWARHEIDSLLTFHLQDPSLGRHDAQLVSSHTRSLGQVVASHRRCREAVIGRKQNGHLVSSHSSAGMSHPGPAAVFSEILLHHKSIFSASWFS